MTIALTSSPAMSALGIDDLIALDIPPRELLLDPILPVKGLAMLHAVRGGAKTFLALSIGLAVASGTSILRWSAPKARRVLYIDGEMTLDDLQKRVTALKAGIGARIPNDHFRLLSSDHTAIPNLATEAGQSALRPFLDGVDLLIIDNLSTLCWSGSENDGGSWTSLQEWLLELRRAGVSVLVVHHSNKSGEQRGTSRREDVLDTVIALRRPPDYSPQDGAWVEVHIDKCRSFSGDASTPFEARLVPHGDGELVWTAGDLKPSHFDEAVTLFRGGATVRAVAKQLGLTKSSAGRLKIKARNDGLLDDDDTNEDDTIH